MIAFPVGEAVYGVEHFAVQWRGQREAVYSDLGESLVGAVVPLQANLRDPQGEVCTWWLVGVLQDDVDHTLTPLLCVVRTVAIVVASLVFFIMIANPGWRMRSTRQSLLSGATLAGMGSLD